MRCIGICLTDQAVVMNGENEPFGVKLLERGAGRPVNLTLVLSNSNFMASAPKFRAVFTLVCVFTPQVVGFSTINGEYRVTNKR